MYPDSETQARRVDSSGFSTHITPRVRGMGADENASVIVRRDHLKLEPQSGSLVDMVQDRGRACLNG